MTSASLSNRTPSPPQTQTESWDLVEVSPLLDVRDLRNIVRRRFKLLIAIPIACVIGALIYLFFIATPMYESSALLFVDPKFDRTLQIENIQSVSSDLDSLNSLERSITSDSMIIRVIDHLNLREDMDFLPKSLRKRVTEGKEISDSRLLSKIRGKRVSASLIRPTRLLELSVLDSDPVRAQKIAKAFVTEFELFLAEQKRKEAGDSERGLRLQAEDAYKRALESEKLLEQFRQENLEFTVEQDHHLFAERLSKVGEELNVATGNVIDLRSRAETLSNIDAEKEPIKVIETGGFSGLKQVSDILARRAAAKSNFALVEESFTVQHPSYRQALVQVNDAEAQLRHLATELKSTVASSLMVADKNEQLLSVRVKELQASLSRVKSASSKFRAIQQKVETEWVVHENLQSRIAQTSLSGEKATAITTVMSEPMVPHKPAKPGKAITVLAAGFLGAFLSFGLVGVQLLRSGPYVDRRQAEEHLNIQAIAQIPPVGSPHNTDQVLVSELSNVLYAPEHRQSRLIHVSAVSDCPDGLRTSACLAAVSARHSCTTLLITVLTGENSNGLVSFTPQPSRTENLYTLTLTSDFLITPNRAAQLLGPHCRKFGRIVIESTAIRQNSQVPAVLTSFADSNLLVVSMEKDSRRDVQETVKHLSRYAKTPLSLVLQG